MNPMLRGPYSGYDEHAVPMRRPSPPPPRYDGGGYGPPDPGYNSYGGGAGGNDRRGRGGRGRNRGRGGPRNSSGAGGGMPPPAAYVAYDEPSLDHFYPPPPPPQESYYRDDYGPGSYDEASHRRPPPPPRREREVNDNIIEERLSRERPCRTLFIRNIKYESNGDAIRARFEEFGEIKTFFDLIANRGMVFVTFYDLRSAERARDRLQGTDISGRPIDVHYSLPRENETNSRCDREKNQGSLSVTLRDSSNRQPINVNEVRRIFSQYGDIKSVRPVGNGRDTVIAEMYDMRATEQIFEMMNHAPLQDGYMELDWAWDIPDTPLPPPAVTQPLPRRPEQPYQQEQRGYEDDYRDASPRGGERGGGGRGRNRGGRGRNNGNYGDRDDYRGRRDLRGGRDDFEPRHNGRQDDRYPEEPYRGSVNGPPDSQPESDRLEAARKVQELLQALKQPAVGPSQSPIRPAQPPAPAASVQQPNYYGAPMPAPNPYATAPSQPAAYPPPPAQSAAPQLIPNAATLVSQLPPSVVQLLQQANALGPNGQLTAYQAPPPPATAAAPNPYGANPYSPPPAVAAASAPPTGGATNPAAMQQILEMIAAQSKRVQ